MSVAAIVGLYATATRDTMSYVPVAARVPCAAMASETGACGEAVSHAEPLRGSHARRGMPCQLDWTVVLAARFVG